MVPASAIYRLRIGNILFEQGSKETDVEKKIQMYRMASEEIGNVLARNPLDHRALARTAEIKREIAVLDQRSKDDAIKSSQLLASLMPGFWQPQIGLAWTYSRLQAVSYTHLTLPTKA